MPDTTITLQGHHRALERLAASLVVVCCAIAGAYLATLVVWLVIATQLSTVGEVGGTTVGRAIDHYGRGHLVVLWLALFAVTAAAMALAARRLRPYPLAADDDDIEKTGHDRRLVEQIEGLALAAGIPAPALTVVPSRVPNAGISTAGAGLVMTAAAAALPAAQTEALVAHSVVWLADRHLVRVRQALRCTDRLTALMGLLWFAPTVVFVVALTTGTDRGARATGVLAVLPLLIIAHPPILFAIGALSNRLVDEGQQLADLSGVRLVQRADGFAQACLTLAADPRVLRVRRNDVLWFERAVMSPRFVGLFLSSGSQLSLIGRAQTAVHIASGGTPALRAELAAQERIETLRRRRWRPVPAVQRMRTGFIALLLVTIAFGLAPLVHPSRIWVVLAIISFAGALAFLAAAALRHHHDRDERGALLRELEARTHTCGFCDGSGHVTARLERNQPRTVRCPRCRGTGRPPLVSAG